MMGYDGDVSLEMEDLTMTVDAGVNTSIDALRQTISQYWCGITEQLRLRHFAKILCLMSFRLLQYTSIAAKPRLIRTQIVRNCSCRIVPVIP